MSAATTVQPAIPVGQRQASGFPVAILSAMAFGLAGSLARALLDVGWTPAAVGVVRIGGAFLVLLLPCLILIRRIGWPSSATVGRLVAYGLVAVASAQLCFFSAVQYLSVGTALLLEYTAPVLLIGWRWYRTRRRPIAVVFVGASVAVLGLMLVLDVLSGVRLHPYGVLWGLGAALSLCVYFILSDVGDGASTHPVILTTAGTGVGGLVLAACCGLGLLPFAAPARTTHLSGTAVPWWAPLATLILVSAVLAYLTGIVAVRRLGSSGASFVALTEVVFAVVFAALLLGQQPSGRQLFGGLLVLGGIAVVQRGLQRS